MRMSNNFRAGWLGPIGALWLLAACAGEMGVPTDELGFEDEGDSAVAVSSQALTGNGTYNAVYRVRAADVCVGGTNSDDACASNVDCPGGTCWLGARRCVGGTNPGTVCINHAACLGTGARCYDQGLKLWNSATTTTSFSLRMADNTAVKMVGTVAPTPPSTAVPPTNGRYRVEHGTETGSPRWGWVDGGALVLHHAPNAGLSAVRTDALMRARSAMGFSYWWGHGKWLKAGPTITCDAAGRNCVPNVGRCAWNAGAPDGCPQCTHTATGGTEYGADCSGFVATIWGFSGSDNNANPETDRVGYNTSAFMGANPGWRTVSTCATPLRKCSGGSRAGKLCTVAANCPGGTCAACPACDCFGSVLPADAIVKTGHIYLTGAARRSSGRVQTYECIDCDTGCTPNSRTLLEGDEDRKAIRKTAAGW